MAVGQYEPVPVDPVRIGRVVAEDPCEQDVCERCERHGGAWVSGSRGTRRVHGEAAGFVRGALQCISSEVHKL